MVLERKFSIKLYVFLFSYFLLQLSSKICSTSTIVSTVIENQDILKTAIVVSLQAFACLFSIFLLQKTANFYKIKRVELYFIVIGVVSSFSLQFVKSSQDIWLVLLFVRESISVLMSTRLISKIKNYSENFIDVNRNCQSLYGLAWLTALSVSPILVAEIGIQNIFVVDFILLVLSSIGIIWLSLKVDSKIKDRNEAYNDISSRSILKILNQNSFLMPMLGVILCIYVVAGFFQVLEVPILVKRFSAKPADISQIFLIVTASYLVGTRIIRIEWMKKNSKELYAISSLLLLLFCSIYFLSIKIGFLYLSCVGLGLSNGFFALSQSNLILKLPDEYQRSMGFTITRFTSNLGLLLSTLILFGFKLENNLMLRLITVSVSLSIFAYVIIRNFFYDFKNVFVKISCFLFSIFPVLMVVVLYLKFDQSFAEILKFSLGAQENRGFVKKIKKTLDCESSSNYFRVAIRSMPLSLDPALSLDNTSAFVINHIYESLYEYLPDNNLVPSLALSHSISPDGRLYRIRINTDKKFSDGTPVTAELVERSLIRSIKKLGKQAYWALGELEGFQDFLDYPPSQNKIKGIKLLDKETLEIRLVHPFPRILEILSAPNFHISYEKNGQIIGSGPYRLKEKTPFKIQLTASNEINDLDVKNIEFILAKTGEESLNLARLGQIDLAEARFLKEEAPPDFNYQEFNYFQALLMYLNTKNEKFFKAQHRCEFIDSFEHAANESSMDLNPISPSIPFSLNLFKQREKARIIMGRNIFKETKVYYTESATGINEGALKKVGAIMKSFNMPISFVKEDVNRIIQKIKSNNFEAVIFSFVPDYLDLDSLLTPVLHSKQQFNFSYYSNEIADHLIYLGREISDNSSRKIVYEHLMEFVLRQDCPVSFLGGQKGRFIVSKKWGIPKFSNLGFKTIRLDKIKKTHQCR